MSGGLGLSWRQQQPPPHNSEPTPTAFGAVLVCTHACLLPPACRHRNGWLEDDESHQYSAGMCVVAGVHTRTESTLEAVCASICLAVCCLCSSTQPEQQLQGYKAQAVVGTHFKKPWMHWSLSAPAPHPFCHRRRQCLSAHANTQCTLPSAAAAAVQQSGRQPSTSL